MTDLNSLIFQDHDGFSFITGAYETEDERNGMFDLLTKAYPDKKFSKKELIDNKENPENEY